MHFNGALMPGEMEKFCQGIFSEFSCAENAGSPLGGDTIAAQLGAFPKNSFTQGCGTKSASCSPENFSTTIQATGDSDGKNRRRRHENGQGKRSQVR
ncbi:MAG: hypothetical protein NTZ64_16370 [Polaromonas sp.]|nr:hypothetical protein [Polaromonas sp.]